MLQYEATMNTSVWQAASVKSYKVCSRIKVGDCSDMFAVAAVRAGNCRALAYSTNTRVFGKLPR